MTELTKVPCLITGQLVEETDIETIMQKFLRFLLYEKNYEISDFKKNVKVDFEIDGKQCQSTIDLLINIDGRSLVGIRFSIGSIVTRETGAISAARLVERDYIVPFAIQCNLFDCAFLDCINKKPAIYEWRNIPDRQTLLSMVTTWPPMALPENRKALEMQRLFAYDSGGCKGASIFGEDWKGCSHHHD